MKYHLENSLKIRVGLYESLKFPAGKVIIASNPPTFASLGAPYGSLGIYDFDMNTIEEVFLFAQMPHSWVESSFIIPNVYWVNYLDGAGTVRWGLEYSLADIGDKFPSPPITIYAESVGVAEVANEFEHQTVDFPNIDMTGFLKSSMFMIRLFRDATHVNDTLTTKAGFLEFNIDFKQDKFGTVTH